jgi:carbonic anhydrase
MKITYILIGLAILSFGLGYFFAQLQPYQNPNKKGASVFVLSCIDPRFADNLAWYLTHNSNLHDDFDLFCLAGASLGGLQSKWQSALFDHIQLGIDLHNIKEIWVVDHLDCGMYKETLKLKSDKTVDIHNEKLNELKNVLKEQFPTLKFRGLVIDMSGNVSQTV